MVIVDTHIFIWDIVDPKRLSGKAKAALDYHESENELCICDISFWEIGLLVGKGRLLLNTTVEKFINESLKYRSFTVLPITPAVAMVVSDFANEINSDPADRIISATALSLKAKLITADKNLRKVKGLKTIW